ncbi:DUF3265 domain-containing protein [Vibrio europaeus]|nr:DUF3265 domain-containing protein [Vibrio europaeus]MDC5721922.1 DUF3265 domain-containing protein [Vibrio europaeus]MDC5758045.1 DUF3265 domain-containing protein [Vibrio europaeus]MDC5776376.1 DUF3265 domain-containing protein [Vibrio europaeus]MDC5795526.1 DUF3265 domain-containing protein [Vibrio europaeus]MDC5798300.1 DUF3265 domain-containing protein [Vibrio europaeus]
MSKHSIRLRLIRNALHFCYALRFVFKAVSRAYQPM